LYARAWTPAKRPAGWLGHQGQNYIPERGERVRLYVSPEKDAGLTLLEPNGCEPAPDAPAGTLPDGR
jgi:hypothetical protein